MSKHLHNPLLTLLLLGPLLAAAPVAWVRFDDAAQEYAGRRYLWLGDGELSVTIDLPTKQTHRLDLLWGAKDDQREAMLIVNGRQHPLRLGGYDGYRWLRVDLRDLPAARAYELRLRPLGTGRPAFLAELRLIDESINSPQPDTRPAASRMTVQRIGGPGGSGEAFPDMRKLWDRQPTVPNPLPDPRQEALFRQAEQNARLAAEALYRCRRFVEGWLAHADPKTGLIPRNLSSGRDLWNGRDAAADNYPFMVLTCALTDRVMFHGRMLEMLHTEQRLTARLDRLPDDYSFSRQAFVRDPFNLDATIFDGAEYVKDGLLPLTEWLGPSPWSQRMLGIMDDIWKHAPVDTPFGKIPTLNFEVNGDLLQACSRLYWFTGDRKYLDWAIRLGDYYLLGNHHPTRDLDSLRLSDHGCEVVNGLSELYAAVSFVDPKKRDAYRAPIHDMLDRILEVARNPDGMLYVQFNPRTGQHAPALCDTWGYNYDAHYTVYLLDRTDRYRQAVRHALSNLKGKYVGAPWADKSADGYADAIEGAINLYNREPVESAADWIDSQIRLMWAIQKPDGIIEGWHGDGNGARTSIMYALWKTQGLTIEPWRPDVRVGAVRDGESLCISLSSDQPWTGRVIFDRARHKTNLRLPLDYPRINQFPEWFVTDPQAQYQWRDVPNGAPRMLTGRQLQDGIAVELNAGQELRCRVAPAAR